ncbi:hypothetical protein ABZ635_11895 [Nocardiopsis sp. NPDC007018]|uniref:hypothetical protein n=1 Tax=Nocardiopsis sp. NPDC007018 TaxID=3155721 RepID=UPI0034017F1B
MPAFGGVEEGGSRSAPAAAALASGGDTPVYRGGVEVVRTPVDTLEFEVVGRD